ncbi:MAG: hypothetical protein M1819_000605 [Sarea resinae]|nr:MAG: hypothetical protein M1819_000605 [Sarea resinae]
MGMPRMIILVRHAQSEGNTLSNIVHVPIKIYILTFEAENRDIHQSVPDHRVKLTQEGWKQAEQAGRNLRSMLKPDDKVHFFTSPYRRTRETTEGMLRSLTSDESSPLSRDSIRVYEEPRLREQDFGNFQPCSAEMERMWQERADYGHFFYRIPNGESAADAYDRVSGFNESLWRQFGDEDCADVCVLVTHGLMTRVFLMKWFHWSVERFEDLRNINHCEFVVMLQNDAGKYILQNELRTWSDLRKQRAAVEGKPVSSTVLTAPAPRRRWGGCPDGCQHGKVKLPESKLRALKASSNAVKSAGIKSPVKDRKGFLPLVADAAEATAPATATQSNPEFSSASASLLKATESLIATAAVSKSSRPGDSASVQTSSSLAAATARLLTAAESLITAAAAPTSSTLRQLPQNTHIVPSEMSDEIGAHLASLASPSAAQLPRDPPASDISLQHAVHSMIGPKSDIPRPPNPTPLGHPFGHDHDDDHDQEASTLSMLRHAGRDFGGSASGTPSRPVSPLLEREHSHPHSHSHGHSHARSHSHDHGARRVVVQAVGKHARSSAHSPHSASAPGTESEPEAESGSSTETETETEAELERRPVHARARANVLGDQGDGEGNVGDDGKGGGEAEGDESGDGDAEGKFTSANAGPASTGPSTENSDCEADVYLPHHRHHHRQQHRHDDHDDHDHHFELEHKDRDGHDHDQASDDAHTTSLSLLEELEKRDRQKGLKGTSAY